MKVCPHVRQVPEPSAGGDCLMDVSLSEVFPCATPGCDAGCPGDGMVRAYNTRAGGIRQQAYVREMTDDGWCWRKAVPA